MKSIYYAVSIAIFTMPMLAGCTTTETSNIETEPTTVAETTTYLTADQIKETIVGNTIEGVAYFKNYGNIPFKMYFEKGTQIYRDRSVVRMNVKTAFGSYRVIEDGQLCRTSKTRRQGKETCFRISIDNGTYKLNGSDGAWKFTIIPGKALI